MGDETRDPLYETALRAVVSLLDALPGSTMIIGGAGGARLQPDRE